ncbi:hypothetical protein U9M48_032956 [Paspalum notatum var. saurae]|uniref:ZZ-type domain-containing protein n=1 Tax=Paspalum notatum var. saurae TaxID=547442 RepID=A0AAQ3U905_PASNO
MDARTRMHAATEYGLRGWPSVDSWNRTIKVKYGGTLKRFNASLNGCYFDHDLSALRLKIASAFNFSVDAEFSLTYTDEDGDAVMLDDANDLHDAIVNQKLNPLRIDVHLSNKVVAARLKQQSTHSKSLEDQQTVLADLSRDSCSRDPPSSAELMYCVSKLLSQNSNMQPCSGFALLSQNSNMQPCSGFADGSKKSGDLKVIGSTVEPSNVEISGVTEAASVKSVLSDVTAEEIEVPSLFPSVKDSLVFSHSGGMKSDLKRSANTETKLKSYVQSGDGKSKSVISSQPSVSITSDAAPTQQSVHLPYMSEKKQAYGSNGTGTAYGNLRSLFLPPAVYPPSPVSPPYNPVFGAETSDLHPKLPTSHNMFSPFWLNTPSSVGMCFPNMYSAGSSHNRMASRLNNYVPNSEGVNSFGNSYRSLGANYGNIPQHAQHRWIQCDVCGVTPIIGPRYKSVVKENYDLCGACFSHIGNKAEYTRLDRPTSTSNMKILGRTPAPVVPNDSQFIKDVTVPDGTPMAPSTLFTKIWRLRNCGSTIWPYGTQLVWVGGDHLACLGSVRLAISPNGGIKPFDETEVIVNFLTPAKPGRYISYWRLALPSGLKFGQRIWVHIQVDPLIQTSAAKQAAARNLNQLPEAISSKSNPFPFDINCVPTEPVFGCPASFRETMEPEKSDPASSDVSSAPTTVEQVQIHVTEAPASSALASMPAPAPEAIPLPNPAPEAISLPNPAPTVCVPTPAAPTVPAAPINPLEEKLLSDLEDLGFTQADLNKQILQQNNYDLEQSVLDLCRFNEWDPSLEEFSELGSDDALAVVNKEGVVSVVDNSDDEGFIVTDVVTKANE